MSFVITSGGTAGHICPALAVAEELIGLGKDVVFAGSISGMEERMAKEAGLTYRAFSAKGFNRQKPWTLLSSSLLLARSTGTARTWLCRIDAQAVAAFGGYASVPVGRAAVREGIPLLIHEQNSHMGWTNQHLSKQAQVIALAYEAAAEALNGAAQKKVVLTGNPVRKEFADLSDPEKAARLRQEFRARLGFGQDDLVLLVFGGSQGARSINNAVIKHASFLMEHPGVSVLHLAGRKEADRVKEALAAEITDEQRARWQVLDYCNEMPAAFAASDVVLSRAGASSLAEISAACKPALLIPFPFATADHQRKNAESLVEAGAARMLLDSELDSAAFSETLFLLIDNEQMRKEMTEAACEFKQPDSAARIAELLISIAE